MLLELARLLKKTVVNFRSKYMFGYLTFSHIRQYWEMQYSEGLHGIMEALTVTQRAWQACSLPVILNQWWFCILSEDIWQLLLTLLDFPGGPASKESTCNAGDPSLIPGSGRYTGEEIGYPLQYSWASLVAQLVKNLPAMQETLVNSWVRKICWRRAWLLTPYSGLENSMAYTSPWTVLSMGLQSVGHDWVTFISHNVTTYTYVILILLGFPGDTADKESTCNVGDLGSNPGLRRSPGEGNILEPTPLFWPEEFHRLYSPWGRKSQTQLSNFHFHWPFWSSQLEACYWYRTAPTMISSYHLSQSVNSQK